MHLQESSPQIYELSLSQMANLQAALTRINDAEETLFNTLTSSVLTDVDKLNMIEIFLNILNNSPRAVVSSACVSFYKHFESLYGAVVLIYERRTISPDDYNNKAIRINALMKAMDEKLKNLSLSMQRNSQTALHNQKATLGRS